MNTRRTALPVLVVGAALMLAALAVPARADVVSFGLGYRSGGCGRDRVSVNVLYNEGGYGYGYPVYARRGCRHGRYGYGGDYVRYRRPLYHRVRLYRPVRYRAYRTYAAYPRCRTPYYRTAYYRGGW